MHLRHSNRSRGGTLGAVAALLAGLAGGAPPACAEQVAEEATLAEEGAYEYAVAPGDVLRIAVWREPELTTDVVVRLDGMISVPLIGEIPAALRSIEDLTSEVRTRLLRFVEVPQVTVSVVDARSARFYVLGEVANSGAYPLTGRTTVIQALAIAGGFREFARRESILIVRESRGERAAIPFNYRQVEAGEHLEQNIALEPGDTVLVP